MEGQALCPPAVAIESHFSGGDQPRPYEKELPPDASGATSPEPYDYGFDQDLPTGPGELKKGPMLFSGEDSVFKIYGQPTSSVEDSAKKKRFLIGALSLQNADLRFLIEVSIS